MPHPFPDLTASRLPALGRWLMVTGLIIAVVFLGVIGYVHHMVAGWGAPAQLDEFFVDVPVPVLRTYRLPNGRRLHTGETGNADGPLVVFIHGTPGRWEDFMWVMRRPELADRALLVSVDRLGWGGSAGGGLETSVRWAIPKPLLLSDEELIPFRDELEMMRPRWSMLRVPVTVVQGDEDRLVPAANADFAQREIVNAPLTMQRVPELGHMIPWERPDLIADAVLEYVGER